MNDSIRQLEEKIAYLERHVTEQDKAMLEFSDELAKVRREMNALREKHASGASGRDDESKDERPPHY